MSKYDKLKPCPFCGSEVVLQKKPLWRKNNDGSTHGYYGCYEYDISCENIDCWCHIRLPKNDTVYRSDEEAKQNAIKAWNRRSNIDIHIDADGTVSVNVCPTYKDTME